MQDVTRPAPKAEVRRGSVSLMIALNPDNPATRPPGRLRQVSITPPTRVWFQGVRRALKRAFGLAPRPPRQHVELCWPRPCSRVRAQPDACVQPLDRRPL